MRRQVCLLAGLMALPASAWAQAHGNPTPPASSQPAPAAPSDLMDYHVVAGDTCGRIARRLFGDARRIDLIHVNNPTMGPTPHHLRAGMVLRVPRHATAGGPIGPDARLTFVRNLVEAFTPDEHPGHVNEPLSRGHRVNTEAASSAEVTFRDETQLQLWEHTLLVIYGDASSRAVRSASPADTTLVRGTLRAHLNELIGGPPTAPPSSALVLATPAGQALLGRGESLLNVNAARTTRLAVYQGRSGLRGNRATVRVSEGFGSRVDPGRRPTPPRPLPGAPQWDSALSRLALANLDPSAPPTSEVGWTYHAGGGPAAAAWHVQLARDAAFNDLVTDVHVPAEVTRFVARGLAAGRYLARVSAVDADHFEGPPSVVSDVTVAAPRLRPTGPLAASLEIPAGLRCAIDDEALAESHSAPVSRLVSRLVPHRLRCAPAGADALIADVDLPRQAEAITVRASLTPGRVGTRSGAVTLAVLDANGVLLPVLPSRVEATNGATLGPIASEGATNSFTADARWPEGTRGFALRVTTDGVALTSTVMAVPPEARVIPPPPRVAHWYDAISLRAEGGVGGALASSFNELGFSLQGTGRVGFSLVDALALQVSAGAWDLTHRPGDSVLVPLHLGLRFEPRVRDLGRFFIDANGGIDQQSGSPSYAGMDVGVGFEFVVSRALGIGPVIRYGRVFEPEATRATGASASLPTPDQFWSAGVSLTLRAPSR